MYPGIIRPGYMQGIAAYAEMSCVNQRPGVLRHENPPGHLRRYPASIAQAQWVSSQIHVCEFSAARKVIPPVRESVVGKREGLEMGEVRQRRERAVQVVARTRQDSQCVRKVRWEFA